MEKELIEQLYKKYGNALLLYIYSICRDFGVSEELMQETFVKALLSLDGNHSNFKAWLFKVGKNLTINRIRRDKKVIYKDEFKGIPTEENILSDLITNEKNRKLYEAILGLPPGMKQILILHYFSEMSFGKIGEIMSISPGNARNTAYKARLLLRKEMEGEHDI